MELPPKVSKYVSPLCFSFVGSVLLLKWKYPFLLSREGIYIYCISSLTRLRTRFYPSSSLLSGESGDIWYWSSLLGFTTVLWVCLGIKRMWGQWERLPCFSYFVSFIKKTFLEVHRYFVLFKDIKSNLHIQKKYIWEKYITSYGFLKWILEITLCIQVSYAVKLLFLPHLPFCILWKRKERDHY